MLRRKETLTIITPIPGFIPRQLAIDILHSHSEIITINPLVLSHKPIPAPRNAAADEYYSTWYEITERIQYVPGMGKMGSGKISFNGCFHDMPWGLQTHIYAPMHVDMRNRYRVSGNQPGVESPEPVEIGLEALGAPKDGLYLREDIEIKCNITVMSFVKAEVKKAGKEMISRMIKKAELLDSGVLKAMFEDGRLKTFNPADRSNVAAQSSHHMSPTLASQSLASDGCPQSPGFAPYQPPPSPSYPQYTRPETASSNSGFHYNPYTSLTPPPQTQMNQPPKYAQQTMPMELPGDYYYQQANQSPNLSQSQTASGYTPSNYRSSSASNASSDPRWSHPQTSPSPPVTQRTSLSSTVSNMAPQHSPNFNSGLSSHRETMEEHTTSHKSYY